jgi:hypothetical protein
MTTRKETTLMVRIGNISQVVTTKAGRLMIEIFDHDVNVSIKRKRRKN